MIGLGLHCTIHQGRPKVVGATVSRAANGQLDGHAALSHLSDAQEDLPLQLKNLMTALESQLPLVGAQAIVVRVMDFAPSINRQTLQKHSQVVGVMLAAARKYCDSTRALNGRDIGVTLGSSKADAETEAAALVGEVLKEAGSAALAALCVAENP